MTSTLIHRATRILPRCVVLMLLQVAWLPACSDSATDSAAEEGATKGRREAT